MQKTLNSPILLFTLCLGLVTIGVVAVYSASVSTAYLVKQLVFATLGLAALLLCYAIDYRAFKKISFWIMISALGLCALVFVPGIGRPSHGAHRWIYVPPFTFQPSEMAKLALIIYMAKMLADRRAYIKSFFSGVMPAMIITGLFALIIVIEPDFGAALVLCLIIFGMWLAAEMRWFHLLGLVACALPAAVAFFLMEDYRWRRLIAFITNDPETRLSTGWQLWQSLIAVGSGGLWGLGLGESHQKFAFVSEMQTDFIFSIMCEELGFIRVSGIVMMFAALILLGWRVALRCNDLFGSLLAAGITLMLFIGTVFNMAVALGLVPTKGLVLPFISAGGSSLIISMAAVGLLMNVARSTFSHEERKAEPRGRREGRFRALA